MGHYRKDVLSIVVNNTCNLKCLYCYVRDLEKSYKNKPKAKVININFAKRGVDDFFKKYKSRKLRFFSSGEATQNFDLMKEITEYARKKAGNKLWIELQTNCVFPEKVAKWVTKNVDMLWISLDGIKDVQDYYRPTKDGTSTFDVIDRNIKIINKGSATIGFRGTIGMKNVDRQNELVDYAKEVGIKFIYVMSMEDYCPNEGISVQHFGREFVKTYHYAKKKGIYYGCQQIMNFDEPVKVACRSLLPMPHLTPDGYVSCCDICLDGENPVIPDFIFGKYNPKTDKIIYYPDRIAKIQSRNIDNLPFCKSCKLLEHCAGGCAGGAILTSGDFYGINPYHCKLTKYLAKRLPELINKGYDPNLPLHP